MTIQNWILPSFFCLALAILCQTPILTAQSGNLFPYSFPVRVNSRDIPHPFAGGMNTPQFSSCDLNADGVPDLVAFDRSGNRLIPYIQMGTLGNSSYRFAPEYAAYFPADLSEWVLLRDFNGDGAADIFTAGGLNNLGMRAFKGKFVQGTLRFDPILFHYPGCDICEPLEIYYQSEFNPTQYNNLLVAPTDIPEIADADGDGDLDIISFEASNGGYIYLWRNKSVDRGFGRDSLQFRLEERCWGKFYESGLVECLSYLSGRPDTCAGPDGFAPHGADPVRHPGSTVAVYDHNGDGLVEVVLGDINFSCLNQMTNTGTLQNAWFTAQDVAFPSTDVPVEVPVFPAAFMVDADYDGKKDMIAASNNKSVQEDRLGVWFYKNVGSNTAWDLEFQQNNFLIGDMIDLGTATHPTFADVNADGLMDLVVGNQGRFRNGTNTEASLHLFLNRGTATSPRFELVDENWLNFRQFSPHEQDYAPSFGDVDGDGDMDLVVGSESGILFFCKNNAGPNQAMQLTNPNVNKNWFLIDVGSSATPVFQDLDCDGKMDLVVGERNGNINFFKNTGTASNPIFDAQPTESNVGGIKTTLGQGFFGFSNPVFCGGGCGARMFTGSFDGGIHLYEGVSPSPTSITATTKQFEGLRIGERTHPAFADLNGDGITEMVVGNLRGGLEMYTGVGCNGMVPTHESQLVSLAARIFPNPTAHVLNIEIEASNRAENLRWEIVSATGGLLRSGSTNQNSFQILVTDLPQGAYILRFYGKTGVGTAFFVKN